MSESTNNVALLTSGGDSQGMNAAIRAVVRTFLSKNTKVFLVNEGYDGLVTQDFLATQNPVETSKKYLKSAKWFDVSGILQRGGTIIGSARSSKFRTRKGRKLAAKNLLFLKISNICVIGGDGSLTGADIFRSEWSDYLEEFKKENVFSEKYLESLTKLHVVGIVGSIDNDFSGTDMTIGVDSALHRITESIDTIQTTASSHKRVFVLEVMGRHCGYLALMSALASAADYVFIPEDPPEQNWKEKIIIKMQDSRNFNGNRAGIIIVAEGAVDVNGIPIKANDVKKVLDDTYDSRVTVLGHVQRGGNTSAFDRILATRMGVAAANLFLNSSKNATLARVIVSKRNNILNEDLMDLVEQTKQSQKFMQDKFYEKCLDSRGESFKRYWRLYRRISRSKNYNYVSEMSILKDPEKSLKNIKKVVAYMGVGAPCAGMNPALKTAIQYTLTEFKNEINYTTCIIYDGFEGLIKNDIKTWGIENLSGLNCEGGMCIGANRTIPSLENIEKIIENLESNNIQYLVIIGGFEAFSAANFLQTYTESNSQIDFLKTFKCVVVPATISCNVPGTDITIGSDTALNTICKCADQIKLSASGSRRRVFIVETMGLRSGYLATLAGLAVGADAAYIFEEKINLNDLVDNVNRLKLKMAGPIKRGIVMLANGANDNYDIDFFRKLYAEEGKGIFDCRSTVLGYVQQGDPPTSYDRKLAISMSSRAMSWLFSEATEEESNNFNFGLISVYQGKFNLQNIKSCCELADFKNRIPCKSWWVETLRPMLKMLAGDIDPEIYRQVI